MLILGVLLIQDGFTPLHKAIIGKKEAVISHLLRKGANPHVKDRVAGTVFSLIYLYVVPQESLMYTNQTLESGINTCPIDLVLR